MPAELQTATTPSRPSIRDVARRAGVSPGCVSNVINGRRRQDDPIGRAVLQAVKELGYRRNTMASNLRRTESRIVGLVIPDFENPFFAELVAELDHCAKSTSYRIVTTSSREDPETEAHEIDELQGWRVAGVLLIPSLGSRAESLVGESETPFVLIDRVRSDTKLDAVSVDNAEASAGVVRELVGLGHRRILIAYLGDGIDNVAERLAGVRLAVAEAGDSIAADYVPTGGSVESARSALNDYLDNNPDPDAIFCLFNTATLAAYGLMQERGLGLGTQTSLVGFDDSAWMAHVHPPVAAIVQPVKELAQQAWGRLLSRIEDKDKPRGVVRVPCMLEARGSLLSENDFVGSRSGVAAQSAAS
ncbi:MAG: LacI family DNA-binding transcriptional regulator [Boseongicola sp.]|nr:MAG: LacI family DNA-binding transcriptional regulator [Boseongicola sp.]